jgi:cytochrome c6
VLSRIAVVVSALALVASGCRKTAKTAEERGASIFARSCASCHGPTGRPPPRQLGFAITPRDLSDARLYEVKSDAQLKASIKDGKGAMPAFGGLLSDADLDLVVAHLHTLVRPQ